MAVMSSLRDKTHIILYTLLAAFLALIVFEWGMNFSGFTGKANQAGKINGKSVPLAQYDEVYKEYAENYRRSNPGAEVTSETELGLQEQAWNTIVDQTLLEEQFVKFGIGLQDQEVVEALDSPTPPLVIRQNFSDPATGVLDRKKLESARRDPHNKELWLQVEKIVRRELKINKLIRALQTLDHVTDREISDIVSRQYSRFSASFIPVTYSFAGADSNFPVKEEETKKYFDEHKELFKQVPSRKADFVFFPLTPSSKDSLSVRKELETIRTEFAGPVNDADYVKVQSDRPTGINATYSRADFSSSAGEALFTASNLKPGTIVGPIADRGEYRLIKIKQITTLAQPIARASHILLRFNPASREDVQKVRELTMLISKQLQAGVPFELLAKKYSADLPSAVNGGDVGWFSKDRMVPEFSAAVFNARPGSIVGPVQTQFGLHIIKVTGFDQSALLCSEIVRKIKPSTETVDSGRRLAMAFQMNAKEKGFEKSATSAKLPVGKTVEFGRHMPVAPIGYSEKVTAFAFKASEGELSEVLETEKGFFVMRLTGKNDTGYRLLDKELKARINAELVREKKGAALEKKLAAMVKGPGLTLEKLAAQNPGFHIVTADEIRWSDGFIPGYGVDRPLVEAMSGLDVAKLSNPVKTSDGYALVVVSKKTLPAGLDIKAEKAGVAPQLLRAKQEQLFAEYFASLRKNAKIEDLRP
ncbi:MAG: peptidylprolyl isomerase [Chlorobiaceae bacterium]|nr:peptidylprolyl isomerase [Chlorobiaceae bacterium]